MLEVGWPFISPETHIKKQIEPVNTSRQPTHWKLPKNCTAIDLKEIIKKQRMEEEREYAIKLDAADYQNDSQKIMELIQESITK